MKEALELWHKIRNPRYRCKAPREIDASSAKRLEQNAQAVLAKIVVFKSER